MVRKLFSSPGSTLDPLRAFWLVWEHLLAPLLLFLELLCAVLMQGL